MKYLNKIISFICLEYSSENVWGMEQSSIFSFPDKFVLLHLSSMDISWSSKLVFNSANISVQILLK